MTDFEREDLELKSVMGDKFQDFTGEPETSEEKTYNFCSNNSFDVNWCERKPKDIPVDAQWHPAKAEPSTMQRVVNTAKWTCLFAGLSWLFFYWQESGMMHPSAAVPCMCACTLMVGWAIGKNMVGGKR